ncbi:MAG: DUF1287 domain-containing protein [Pyrinomonadaceae bacterium]
MKYSFLAIAITIFFANCIAESTFSNEWKVKQHFSSNIERPKLDEIENQAIRAVLQNANSQLESTISYTQKYFVIPYPNGDVPLETGACTDVVIRAFRGASVDLQKEVHEDMKENFVEYPQKWGLAKPDTNIDHRRVPNLQTYFKRTGKSLAISDNGEDYQPGDVITWDLDGKGMTHIGLISNIWNKDVKRYMIIHNIGGGANLEDRLFKWKITGHYRFFN